VNNPYLKLLGIDQREIIAMKKVGVAVSLGTLAPAAPVIATTPTWRTIDLSGVGKVRARRRFEGAEAGRSDGTGA